ncbi:hypothetical protein AZI87_01500 [Bdellovibrio bacteriovorus]|uniref:Uncharacterized protein n=1 Tax=Bdellovibrio bacteriovorus TaxID=959 RepID=A0A161PCX2_BDEBC|nr:hypothetical protein AZI87_01500 [Bdellovibrio bacteriovorus]
MSDATLGASIWGRRPRWPAERTAPAGRLGRSPTWEDRVPGFLFFKQSKVNSITQKDQASSVGGIHLLYFSHQKSLGLIASADPLTYGMLDIK